MTSDRELLERFAQAQDHAAFAELVARHITLVYGTARRMLRPLTTEADDVTQAVFLLLAQRAHSLRRAESLAAWLYRATGYCCANVQKTEGRRRKRERIVAMQSSEVSPNKTLPQDDARALLDEALAKLPHPQREALLLRYFENHTAAQTAAAVGVSTKAIEKRLARGLENLRHFFLSQGFAVEKDMMAQALSTEGAQIVPPDLAATIAAGIGAKSGAAAAIAKGASSIAWWVRAKILATAAAAVAASICSVIAAWIIVGDRAAVPSGPAPALPAPSAPVALAEPATTPDASPVVTTIPAHLTKAQLLDLAEKRAAAIHDLAVEYDFVPVTASLADSIGFHYKVALKADKIYIDDAHGIGQDTSRSRNFTAFNGIQWVRLQGSNSMAVIDKQPFNPFRLRDMGWFELAMLSTPSDPAFGSNDGSLVTLLSRPTTIVHRNIETVAGRPCIVVDDIAPGWGGLEHRVWLDIDRGLLTMRWAAYPAGDEGIIFRTLDAAQVARLWFPTFGEREVRPSPTGGRGFLSRMEVRDRNTPYLGLHINQNLADDLFNLAIHLPPNTTIDNRITKAPLVLPKKWGRPTTFDPPLPGE